MSASYKVSCHLEFYEQSNGEVVGFFTSRDAVCRFRLRFAVFRTDCRMTHPSCDKWDHPPTGFAPSSSSFCFGLRRHYIDGAFHGVYFNPSSRHQLGEAFFYALRLPRPNTFTSFVFHTRSTFFASLSLVSLFHLTTACRVRLQGFVPPTQEMKLVAPSLPSRRFSRSRL
jgi:hypothetical protein